MDEIREKNLDNVEDYGNQESEDEYEDVEEETSREPDSQETSVPPKEPVSEMDIIKAKLAKARKAMNAGLLKRKAAVASNIERRYGQILKIRNISQLLENDWKSKLISPS